MEKKSNSQNQRVVWWFPGAGGGENGEVLVKGKPFSYETNKFWGTNAQKYWLSLIIVYRILEIW